MRLFKWLVILGFALSLVNPVYAKTVKDNNKGNKGDILMHSGSTAGKSNVGTWVNSSAFKGEKGDKGTNGTDGVQGIQGIQGIKGKAADMTKVRANSKAITSNSSRIDNNSNRLGELEKTQTVLEVQGRVYDSKKWKVKLFFRYNFTRNKVDTIGVKATYKFGKSYEEKRIDTLEAKVNKLLKIEAKEEINNIEYAKENYNVTVNADGLITITNKF